MKGCIASLLIENFHSFVPIDVQIPVIGLVGGVGSGKSRVARQLGEIEPIAIVDGDVAGHQVLEERAVKTAIRQRFGEVVFDERENVDRKVLGELVFGDNEKAKLAKADLEAIVHPRIGEILKEQISQAQADANLCAVILDAAVMLETGWKDVCDAIVFVDVPEQMRRKRVVENRGWTAEKFTAREASQLPLETKRKLSDFVIDNSGPEEHAAAQLQTILKKMDSPRRQAKFRARHNPPS